MLSNTVQFWVYLILLVPSMICLLFILYHLLFNRTLRSALNNHVIIVLLLNCFIAEVTIYPWMLYFYQYKGVWIRSQIFCAIWGFLDWGLYITQTILFAWASIERHILIFHDGWVSTKKKRFFIHYLPLILLLLYCFIFYIIVFFFPPCTNSYGNSSTFCIIPCLAYNHIFSVWETIVHQMLFALIIIVSNIALFVRVLWQKHRMHQPVQWRKHRKMAIQVLSISLLYLAFFFPYVIYSFILTFGAPNGLGDSFYVYAVFLTYFMTPLLSFVCTLSLPELRTKLIKIIHFQQKPRRIGPEIFGLKPIT